MKNKYIYRNNLTMPNSYKEVEIKREKYIPKNYLQT